MLELKPRGSFVDLGCGSGVLAIAAAKLGFSPVSAVDAERQAIEATRQNALDNGVALAPERGSVPALAVVERFDLRNRPAPRADVVAANLMRPLLLRVAELWAGARPATLIVSGLLDHEADEVAAAFAPLREERRLSRLGWSALLLQLPETR
jgi:ribosomal protein L11 methyltransferase